MAGSRPHEELKAWGRPGGMNSRLILKSDPERSLVALREALAKVHGGLITPEQPPTSESASNGRVEEAGRTIRDMVRVLKLQLESKLKRAIAVQEPIMQWMVRWAAMLLSRFRVGGDGQTAFQRQTGKRCITDVVPYAETVWYRELHASGERKRSIATRWKTGVWLGHARNSSEALIGTLNGVVRAWAVRRKAAEERWKDDIISAMTAIPADPSGLQATAQRADEPQLVTEDSTDEAEEERVVEKRLRISKADILKYGLTPECDGCRKMDANLNPPTAIAMHARSGSVGILNAMITPMAAIRGTRSTTDWAKNGRG